MRGPGVFVLSLAVVLVPVLVADVAAAMCGCMLQPAPRVGEQQAARIINKTSKVILARQGDTTVLTMANDFEGAPAEFGMVVPVPTVIRRQDVKIVDDKVFAWFEEQTAPRVVEVFEPDPCAPQMMLEATSERVAPSIAGAGAPGGLRAADFGVKVESHFFAGEYEIAVLSGKDGSGLIRWLQAFHYDIPNDAQRVLESYIKQKMMFFLARVHVKEMGTGRRHLRPIQVRYQTPKYMLPIRLGMVNAQGPQELLVFALTPQGRAEPTNYRSVRVPTGQNLPHFVKSDWTSVYGAIFDEATKREDMRVVFVEDARFLPPTPELDKAGALFAPGQGGAFTTRLHFRYDEAHFPEDLVLQSTNDQTPFHVMFSAVAPASSTCAANSGAPARRAREQQTLVNLTGWPMDKVLERVGENALPPSSPSQPTSRPPPKESWWERIWK